MRKKQRNIRSIFNIMKKILNIIFMLLFILIFFEFITAEKEYDLGEKKVIGRDKKGVDKELKIIKKTNEKIKLEEIDIKLDDEKIEVIKEPEITIDSKAGEGALIDTKPARVIDNKMIFGMGGYKRIDSFNYLIDYGKEDTENDLFYFFHIDRVIRGQDRRNSNVDSDNFAGKIEYKFVSLGLSHSIKDENFPGRKGATNIVNSFKHEKVSCLNLKLKLLSDIDQNLIFGFDLYSKKVESISTPEREYKNNYYNFFASYDNFFNMASFRTFVKFTLNYYRDNMFPDKTGCLKLGAESKMRQKGDNPFIIELKLGGEYVNRNEQKKEYNYLGNIKITKYLSRSFSLGLGVEKGNMNKASKDIFSSFSFDNDILPFYRLKREDNLKAEFIASLNRGIFLLTGRARHMQSKEKIIYEEDSTTIPDEIPIRVLNHSKIVEWQEVHILNSYNISYMLKINMIYIYRNLKNIPFSPYHRFVTSLGFSISKYTVQLEGKYYSPFYGSRNENNKINEYKNLNLRNSYYFSPNLVIGLNIYNLINWKSEKKTEYPIGQRKIMLELRFNY